MGLAGKTSIVEFPEVPSCVRERVRAVCLALPEAVETQTDVGWAFRIRQRIFAYVFGVVNPEGRRFSMLVCRADPEERQVLLAIGHPFFAPGSGGDRIGVVIEDTADWDELAELITESYRLLAPRKLVSLLEVGG